MEMLATERSIKTAQRAASFAITEATVDEASRQNFLSSINLLHTANLIPFALLSLSAFQLKEWSMLALSVVLNAAAVWTMFMVGRRIQAERRKLRRQLLWNVYEALALCSGVLWTASLLPIMDRLGQTSLTVFICAVVIGSVTVTCLAVATQWRTFVSFLAGVMLGLLPQTIFYLGMTGPVPLLATLALGPALVSIAYAVRRQHRSLLRTHLERKMLATELAEALAAAEYLANRDSLTGLFNRRAFEVVAETIRSRSLARPPGLILVDLDNFKLINDRYGHAIGDAVLKRTAALIDRHNCRDGMSREGDAATARWGGEEFIILLGNSSIDVLIRYAEALRARLSLMRDPAWPEELVITGSLGIATWPSDLPLHAAIHRADQAMYQAKRAGRNQIRVYAATRNSQALPRPDQASH